MVNPHHLAHWYPTAAYLYVFWLDALALAWEYLRRHPDYRLDWLRRHRRPEAAHRWGLRLLEDPMLDARDAHPAWLPGHAAVVQLYPDADPPQDATAFAFWRIPGHKQLFHDGKKLATPEEMADFLAGEGIDKDKFLSTYNSFAVKGKVEDAKKKAQAYQISGVPTMVVNGKYRFDLGTAGGPAGALSVADQLIAKERAAGAKN